MTKIDFRPEANGFAFQNSFAFTEPERAALLSGLAPAVDGALAVLGPFGLGGRLFGLRDNLARIAFGAVPQHYGLCGGMAFAALDFYRVGRPIPRGDGPRDQPPPGSPLHAYLWERLLQSWQLNGITFLEWKARLHVLPRRWPFDAGPRALRDRSRQAWKKLQERIDAGEATPIGLVGELPDPFQDHQVLAYGYERTGDRSGRIIVYDSNCPDGAQSISVDFSGEMLITTETCARPGNSAARVLLRDVRSARSPAARLMRNRRMNVLRASELLGDHCARLARSCDRALGSRTIAS